MSTLTETVEHVLRERELAEAKAAAREEARETIARHLSWCASVPKRPEDRAAMEWAHHAALEVVLTASTPLAATIRDLRIDAEQTAAVTKQLSEDLDAKHAKLVEVSDRLRAELEAVRDQAAEAFDTATAAYEELRAERDAAREWLRRWSEGDLPPGYIDATEKALGGKP